MGSSTRRATSNTVRNRRLERLTGIYSGQILHGGLLIVLLIGLDSAQRSLPGFDAGSFLGWATPVWVALNVANAVVHQVFVWFSWRFELYAGLLRRWLGPSAFRVYSVVFAALLAARPVLITCLAFANRHSLNIGNTAAVVISIVLALPVLYLAHSVVRYFGFERACGIDHFDPGYRTMALVEHGIFRFSANPMYTYGFLLLWIPGILLQSMAALAVALFSHLYIWVHYWCTERPDMHYLYGDRT